MEQGNPFRCGRGAGSVLACVVEPVSQLAHLDPPGVDVSYDLDAWGLELSDLRERLDAAREEWADSGSEFPGPDPENMGEEDVANLLNELASQL